MDFLLQIWTLRLLATRYLCEHTPFAFQVAGQLVILYSNIPHLNFYCTKWILYEIPHIGTEQEACMGAGCRTRSVTLGTRCQAKSTDAWGSALYKLNIVGLDAFLKLAVAIASIPYCMAGSGWVFATVVRIFRWNHSAGTQSLAAAPEGWRPRNNPQNMLLCSNSHSPPQPNPCLQVSLPSQTTSGWVFATVDWIFCWNNSAWSAAPSGKVDGLRPVNNP